MPTTGADIHDGKPGWASIGVVSRDDADGLFRLIERFGPRVAVELGTASGVSTAILASALQETHGHDWQLHTFDVMEHCYFDQTKRVGQAATEMIGSLPNVFFHRSATAFDFRSIVGDLPVNFAFIDAAHEAPWAAVDLLCLLKNLCRGTIVALHDVLLPFRVGFSHQNGPRDLFRVWRGQKWIDERAPNLGIIRVTDLGQAIEDIASCMQLDWDVDPDPDFFMQIAALIKRFDRGEYPVFNAYQERFRRYAAHFHNENEFCRASQAPFVTGSAIHPNDGLHECSVIWQGLAVGGAKWLDFVATARDSSPDNPGALLRVRTSAAKERSWVDVALMPGEYTPVEVPLDGEDQIDLEIKALVLPGKTASYAGVSISRFTLRT